MCASSHRRHFSLPIFLLLRGATNAGAEYFSKLFTHVRLHMFPRSCAILDVRVCDAGDETLSHGDCASENDMKPIVYVETVAAGETGVEV